MTKRAILALGPESAGNHLLMQCLLNAGCDGDAGDVQRWDTIDPSAPLIAWGRSVPSNGVWPDIVLMAMRLRRLGYEVQAVVITRNWRSTTKSQVRRGRVADEDAALANLRRAMPHIFNALAAASIPYVVCHYDYLVTAPAVALAYLCDALGLDRPGAAHVMDANKKYEACPVGNPLGGLGVMA